MFVSMRHSASTERKKTRRVLAAVLCGHSLPSQPACLDRNRWPVGEVSRVHRVSIVSEQSGYVLLIKLAMG